MCNDIAECVAEVESGRVFTVEDGGVWFSGMNAHVGTLVSRVSDRLRKAGYQVGPALLQNGGVYLVVPNAEEVPNDKLDEIAPLDDGVGTETEAVQ